jgi:hypothetical protein
MLVVLQIINIPIMMSPVFRGSSSASDPVRAHPQETTGVDFSLGSII